MANTTLETDWTACYEQLYRFAMKLCGDVHNAEDLVQQTYAQAFAKREQFIEGTRLDSWLYRILQNIYFNQRNSAATALRKRHLFVVEEEQTTDEPSRLDATRSLDRVVDVIGDMPEHYRIVLLLVVVEGFSYQEVADSLQLPIGTVTSRLARARSIVVKMCVNPMPGRDANNINLGN